LPEKGGKKSRKKELTFFRGSYYCGVRKQRGKRCCLRERRIIRRRKQTKRELREDRYHFLGEKKIKVVNH